MQGECSNCGLPFVGRRSSKAYCSERCKKAAQRARVRLSVAESHEGVQSSHTLLDAVLNIDVAGSLYPRLVAAMPIQLADSEFILEREIALALARMFDAGEVPADVETLVFERMRRAALAAQRGVSDGTHA